MTYEIRNNNNLVYVAKTIKEIELYFKKHHPTVRGFGQKSLSKKFKLNDTVEKKDLKVIKVNDDKKRLLDKKLRQNIISSPFTNQKVIRYKNEIMVNDINKYDFIKQILDQIKKLPEAIIKNSFFQITLTGKGFNLGTVFTHFNKVMNEIEEIIDEKLIKYADDFYIEDISIKYYNKPDLENVVVYGSKNKLEIKLKDDFNTRIKILNNMTVEDYGYKKLIKLLSNNMIINPSTIKNCFIKACFIAKFKKLDIREKVKKFIKYNVISEYTIKFMGPLLASKIKRKINVFFPFDLEQNKTYGSIYDEEINILIYGTHAYALIKKEGEEIIDTDNQEIIEKPDYKAKYVDYHIATFDLETCDTEEKTQNKNNTTVYACGFYINNNYKEFYKKKNKDNVLERFLNYILSDKTPNKMIIYAHNGGKFDTYILLKIILKSYECVITNFMEQSGRIINLELYSKKNKKQIVFRDSINLIAGSLDDACKSFKPDIVKLDGDVNHNKININNCHTKKIYDYTKDYLKNDCISLYLILKDFNNIIYNAYGFEIKEILTNASIARRVYLEKYYNPEEKPQFNLSSRIDNEIRKYYFGGRNEVMTKLGRTKKDLFYVDFTSLYPYVMNKYDYQYGEMKEEDITDKEFDNNWFGFVKVLFKHKKKNKIPLHAVVKDSRLTFPYIDNPQEAIISTEEIKYSIENDLGYEYKFIKLYGYEKKDKIFKGITDDLYKMKIDAQRQSNAGLRAIAKIIINSSYGFWGMNYLNRTQKKIIKEFNDKQNEKGTRKNIKSAEDKTEAKLYDHMLKRELKDYKRVGGYDVYNVKGEIKASCVNVGLASMITSYARLELYKLLKAIDDKGGNIYYMDTDSAITDYNIYKDIDFQEFIGEAGENLGELTNEGLDEVKGEIKDYYIKKIIKKYNLNKNIDRDKIDEIFNKKYKPKLKKWIEKYDINYKKGYNNDDKEAIAFDELITLGNKMYALKKKFKYNNIDMEINIIKMKGVNAKQKYKNKIIKEDKIIFTNIDKIEGKKKINFDDYKLISKGYNLICDNMNFISGVEEIVCKDKNLIKLNNQKKIKKLYTKGILDKKNRISPVVI